MSARLVDDAKALILERGTIRSSAIAELLDCTPENVHELLRPSVESGELIACAVEAGGEKLIDYRHSVAGKGHAPFYNHATASPPALKKPPTPVRDSAPAPARTASAEQPKKETRMTNTDRIVAALKKHGPMTTPQLRASGVKSGGLASLCAAAVVNGTLKRLGGGARSSVWGLPGQKLPAAGDGVDMDAATPHAKKKTAKPEKRVGGGGRMPRGPRKKRHADVRRIAQEAAARRVAGIKALTGTLTGSDFRPAIACDGALLLTGAARLGELNSAETRVLAEFLARAARSGAMA